MIRTFKGTLLETAEKHIAFAANTEGSNCFGFAGIIARDYWPELTNIGKRELGTVISKEINGKVFHALVCYSLKDGWPADQIEVIKTCFDNISLNENEPIACAPIGDKQEEILSGAKQSMIIIGMGKSDKNIRMYLP